MAKFPDMEAISLNSQALTVDFLGKGFAQLATRQAGIFDMKVDEVDLLQAASAKELTKAGENPRYGPQALGTIPSVVSPSGST